MKYLILLLVIVGAAWWIFGRRRPPADGAPPRDPGRTKPASPPQPQAMLACVHCGMHLPQADALLDAQARPFCSEAHRLAGPR